ncbi:hypothetical protein Dsin_008310 [Dipteronia sinensis]|uniref:DUF4283 domain-containing protein n=1 Tax=Dipteronia sinensis TaxID=43782 RepID=A0AAE0AP51_9ROSI|nr:hypothetical protein Dsin_008310 [Dipteronia sinensis]
MMKRKLLDNGQHRLALCLIWKVMKTKLVNREVSIDVMTRVWQVNGGVEIEAVEGNVFAFYFKNGEDRQRILLWGPWYFDKVTTMLLLYERLPDYYFKCGRLGHTMRECFMEGEKRDVKSETSLRLGMWLLAVCPPKRPHVCKGRRRKQAKVDKIELGENLGKRELRNLDEKNRLLVKRAKAWSKRLIDDPAE